MPLAADNSAFGQLDSWQTATSAGSFPMKIFFFFSAARRRAILLSSCVLDESTSPSTIQRAWHLILREFVSISSSVAQLLLSSTEERRNEDSL